MWYVWLACNQTPWSCWKQGNAEIAWKRHCLYYLHCPNAKQLPGPLGVVRAMEVVLPTSLQEMLEHGWVLTLAHMGLEKSEKMLAALFQAYLHMFFSMQNVSVHNLIVVGFFFASINTYANDSHLQLCCINHMCASVCLPYRLRVEERVKEGNHSFNLQENSLMQTEVRQQTAHQGCDWNEEQLIIFHAVWKWLWPKS